MLSGGPYQYLLARLQGGGRFKFKSKSGTTGQTKRFSRFPKRADAWCAPALQMGIRITVQGSPGTQIRDRPIEAHRCGLKRMAPAEESPMHWGRKLDHTQVGYERQDIREHYV